MMRFEPQRRPPNFFARRFQWRLLAMVLSLGLVLIMMGQLRKSETADRIGQIFSGDRPQPTAERAVSDQQVRELITAEQDLPEGAFHTPLPPREGPAGGEEYLPGIDPAMFDSIRDNSVFRSDETTAWFQFWEALEATSPAEMAAADAPEVGYVQLVEQPQVYRGKLVTVRGVVHRVETLQPGKNDMGLDKFHLLTIRPAGQQIWPLRVYARKVPGDFPAGDDPRAPVAVTGLFFKNWSYEWEGGMGLAPVVLANDIQRLDRSTAERAPARKPPSLAVVALGAAALAAMLLGYVAWSVRSASGERFRPHMGRSHEE